MIPWIQIAGAPGSELENEVASSLASRISSGKFSAQDVANISNRKLWYQKNSLSVTNERLELLRALCQHWYIDFKPGEITSHRPVIGKIIVAFKKCLLPVMRMLLKDVLIQQRAFNAHVIEATTKLADDISKLEEKNR